MTTAEQPLTIRQTHHGRKRSLREYVCERCGDAFVGRVDKHRKFCSRTCGGKQNGAKPGAANPRYNGGLCLDKDSGRWVICCRDGTTMLYARGVMAAKLGRLLASGEIVHHINGNPSDDREENLALTTRSEHINIHRADLLAGRWG